MCPLRSVPVAPTWRRAPWIAAALTAVLVTAACVAESSASPNISFLTPFSLFHTGVQPRSLAVGDLDLDGKLDLVTADNGSGSISVLRGNGPGAFLPATSYGGLGQPQCVAIADLNRDGWPDVVVTNGAGNTVSVFLGIGGGGLSAKGDFTCGANPIGVAVADLNHDGWPDVITTNSGSNTVSILLGSSGGLLPKIDVAVGAGPSFVTVRDIDGDGNLDLAIADNQGSNVELLFGNGDGTFSAPIAFATPGNGVAVAITDLNRDGVSDIVAVSSTPASYVSVWIGRGGRVFAFSQSTASGNWASSMAVRDVNHDGYLDVLVSNESDNLVTILLGSGDGKFYTYATRQVDAGIRPDALTVQDLDGDGIQDLILASSGQDGVLLMRGNGDGTFGPSFPPKYAMGGYVQGVATGDLNADGRPDLVAADGDAVSVLLSTGNGRFGARTDYSTLSLSKGVALGDLNGDGKLDAVVACYDYSPTLTAYLGRGDGTFGARTDFGGEEYPAAVALGDFNNDGKLDLVTANNFQGSYTSSVQFGNGDGTFGAPIPIPSGYEASAVATGDLNRDGVPDLLFADQGGQTATVWYGRGDGTFFGSGTYAAGRGPSSIAVADLNGDGLLDFVVANEQVNGAPGSFSVYLGDGRGNFAREPDVITRAAPVSVAIADIDGDLIPDAITANSGNGTVSVLRGHGDGTFDPPVDFPAGNTPQCVIVADFNGDGRPDLAVGDFYSAVVVLLNTTPWLATPTTVEMFQAEPADGGVELEWKTASPTVGNSLRPERAATEAGPYMSLGLTPHSSGDTYIAVDRGAAPGHTWWYRLNGTLADGTPFKSEAVSVTLGAGITTFALDSPHPNPTNAAGRFDFVIPRSSSVCISLLDVSGRRAAVLINGDQQPGRHSASFDASDLSPGLYWLELRAPGTRITRPVAVIR
jgi:FG-GAP-like repeat